MSERVLPEGWVSCVLADVASIQSGVGFPKAFQGEVDGQYPVYKVGDISKAVLNSHGVLNKSGNYVSAEVAGKMKGKVILPGSTVFAKIGEAVRLNRRAWVASEGLVDNNVMAVKAVDERMDLFVNYFLRTVDLNEVARSTAVPSVRKGDVESLGFLCPPLEEQKAIADKLDELLAQVNNLKTRLDAIPAILKRFRKSVLAAAVSGELPSSPLSNQSSNEEVELGDLLLTAFDGPFGSKLKTSDYTDAGVGVSRLENIRHLWFDGSKRTYVSKEKYEELKGNKLERNDVLFSSFVDEEVRVCLFPYEGVEYINKADCFCLRADREKVVSKFLMFLLASHGSYFQIKGHVQGVTRPRVNLKILKSLKFKVPGVDEQAEIVRRVDQLFAFADQIEQQVSNAQTRVNKLTQSILAKAFRGELTAEWRAENPELISGEHSAEALLERIKAEKAKQTPTKTRRGGRKATVTS